MAAPPYTSWAGALPAGPDSGSISPCTTEMPKPLPKNVSFELVFDGAPQYRARLPLRVQIYQHDSTESIVTTVKNFYGLYSGPTISKGVSFEDEQGNTLIARYENFRNHMVVYVRVFDEPPLPATTLPGVEYHSPISNGEAYTSQAQQHTQHISRPTSRTSRRRSPSPNTNGRRSDSTGTKRSQTSRTRGPASQNGHDGHGDSTNGYTSGDGAPSSASGKSKEQLGNTEISVENIVEGGRRKRAKFESSELPLFAPPQMPAATSNPSVSPVRRMDHHRQSMGFIHPNSQNPFTNPRPIQSPHNYGNGYGYPALYTTPAPDHRHRHSIGYSSAATPGTGILPTPDPTVGSCMSEEDKDVAMQLMRLGDLSNISHGRTSASTVDDTFSGRADAASSTGATSESEGEDDEEQPAARRQRLDMSGGYQKILPTTEGHFALDSAEASGDDGDYNGGDGLMAAPKHKGIKPRATSTNGGKSRSQQTSSKTSKNSKTAKPKLKKATSVNTIMPGPMSPASLPASRKQSVVSSTAMSTTGNGDDEPDLSTKPRCQRCRKSKKGCDRQRPCGRCKDAGIPADQCISEDEGNGRKGRYGRHMGVPVKIVDMPAPPSLLPAAPITTANGIASAADKNKKRKR